MTLKSIPGTGLEPRIFSRRQSILMARALSGYGEARPGATTIRQNRRFQREAPSGPTGCRTTGLLPT